MTHVWILQINTRFEMAYVVSQNPTKLDDYLPRLDYACPYFDNQKNKEKPKVITCTWVPTKK